jgi:hypothetical protein
MLDEQVRMPSLQHRVEPAQDHRMRERPQRLGLVAEIVERLRVGREPGTQHLRDHDREPLVVPDRQHLVPAAAAEGLEHRPSRRDLGALDQPPARIAAHERIVAPVARR